MSSQVAAPRWALPIVFLLCVLPLGLFFARVVPPAEVPDEPSHLIRAYALSIGQWIGHRETVPNPFQDLEPAVTSGFSVDPALFQVADQSHAPDRIITRSIDQARRTIGWTDQLVFAVAPGSAIYAPLLYIPGAVAFGLGRHAGASPSLCIELVRGANLICYAVLGFLALRWASRGRLLLLCLLSLPISVALAASANPDGLLVAVVALGVAFLTRPEPGSTWRAAIALGAACLAKPPYLPLLGALLAGSGGGWRRFGRNAGLAVLAAVPALLWSAAAMHWAAVPFMRPQYHPGPLYQGAQQVFATTDPQLQLAILKAHPGLLLVLPWRTIEAMYFNIEREWIGVLGQLDLVLPGWIYLGWTVVIAACLVLDVLVAGTRRATPGLLGVAFVVLGAIANVWLIYLLQYINWTSVGLTVVEGVQGRYYLPIFAILIVVIPSLSLFPRWRSDALFCVPVLVMSVLQYVAMTALMVRRYYLG